MFHTAPGACVSGPIYINDATVGCNPNKMAMLARGPKPKLSLNLTPVNTRPVQSLQSPLSPLRSPISPSPNTPTMLNTRMNQRGFSTFQLPTYAYTNHSTSRSILRRERPIGAVRRQLQFCESPQIHPVTPIEEADYYGEYTKMTREERRWRIKS